MQHIFYFLKFIFNLRKVDIAVILKLVNWFTSQFFFAIASLCSGEISLQSEISDLSEIPAEW